MSRHPLAALLTVLAIVTLAPAAGAQTEASMEAPRTPWGAPDLQGVWDFRSLTPMERPEELADTETFTAEQAAEFAEETIRTRSRDNDTSDRVVPYNDFWFDEGTSVTTERTYVAGDRSPGRTDSRADAGGDGPPAGAGGGAGRRGRPRADGGRVRRGPRTGRAAVCAASSASTRARRWRRARYNNNVQGVPDRGHRGALQRDEPQRPASFRWTDAIIWMRASGSGRVIRAAAGRATPWSWRPRTSCARRTSCGGATTPNLTLVERLTRVDADTLRYDVTVDDPTVWTRPWTFSVPMRRNPEPLYEYACHEGNYGLYNILAGRGGGGLELARFVRSRSYGVASGAAEVHGRLPPPVFQRRSATPPVFESGPLRSRGQAGLPAASSPR